MQDPCIKVYKYSSLQYMAYRCMQKVCYVPIVAVFPHSGKQDCSIFVKVLS
jgi:hypothetical protein